MRETEGGPGVEGGAVGDASDDAASSFDTGRDGVASGDAALPADAATAAICGWPGLIAFWSLDEGSGTTAHDCSPNRLDGLLQNTPPWVAGRHGDGALAFSPTTGSANAGYVTFGTASALQRTGSMTVAAWIKIPSGTPQALGIIIDKHSSSNAGGWQLAVKGGAASFQVPKLAGSSFQGYVASANGPILPQGSWVHVAGVFTSGVGVEVFVAGARAASIPYTGGMFNDPTFDVHLGVSGPSNLAGDIDDVALFGRALADSEIAALAAF